MNDRLDQWLAEAQNHAGGRVLGYDEKRDSVTVGLLNRPGLEPWDDFTCLNSLRDVEPNVGLIFDDGGLDDEPGFVAAVAEGTPRAMTRRSDHEHGPSEKRKVGEHPTQPAPLQLRRGLDRRTAESLRAW